MLSVHEQARFFLSQVGQKGQSSQVSQGAHATCCQMVNESLVCGIHNYVCKLGMILFWKMECSFLCIEC